MLVKCITNNLHDIENPIVKKKLSTYIGRSDGELNLETNKKYTVYGVVFWDNHPWFYLCTDDLDYPTPYSSVFFDVIDNRLSKYWVMSTTIGSDGDFQTSLTIEPWASDRFFYERLIDGDNVAIDMFTRSKDLIIAEQDS